tara:strand:+ start:100 stop:267 length:168 start_codon:yes stop_codon:yes gene_type:complete
MASSSSAVVVVVVVVVFRGISKGVHDADFDVRDIRRDIDIQKHHDRFVVVASPSL